MRVDRVIVQGHLARLARLVQGTEQHVFQIPPKVKRLHFHFWPNSPVTIWRRKAQRTSAASRIGSLLVSALSTRVVAIGTISFSDTFSVSSTRNTRSSCVCVS